MTVLLVVLIALAVFVATGSYGASWGGYYAPGGFGLLALILIIVLLVLLLRQ